METIQDIIKRLTAQTDDPMAVAQAMTDEDVRVLMSDPYFVVTSIGRLAEMFQMAQAVSAVKNEPLQYKLGSLIVAFLNAAYAHPEWPSGLIHGVLKMDRPAAPPSFRYMAEQIVKAIRVEVVS